MKKQGIKKSRKLIMVNVSVILLQEDDQYVAYCPALEVSSYGDTIKEAKAAFDEALEIFLEETTAKGTLEKELLRLGWILQQKPKVLYQPPSISLKESQRLLKKNPKNIYDEKVALPVS